ncbi:radical SAM protein [Candidatus Riflebacteria bacterium]
MERKFLDAVRTVCNTCSKLVQGSIFIEDNKVVMDKFCPEHGKTEGLISSDAHYYLDSLSYLKAGSMPDEFQVKTEKGCPSDCGFCPEHEQHICMPVIEITDLCDLSCPVCIADTKNSGEMDMEVLKGLVQKLIAAEGTIDVLNLSGGEPTIHPRYREIIAYLRSVPEIHRVSVSTNGLSLLREPELLKFHKDNNIIISLQFDGFQPETYLSLRGNDLAAEKMKLLNLLTEENVTASLIMTVAGGINDTEIASVFTEFMQRPNLVSLMFQPFASAGRGGNFQKTVFRATIPDVIKNIVAGSDGLLQKEDFTPLPCCHPECFTLTYLLGTEDGEFIPMKRLLKTGDYLDIIRNRSFFGTDEDSFERIKELVYDLWSAPAAAFPENEKVLKSVKGILKEISAAGEFSADRAIRIAERKIKSVFIHQFMDRQTFDVSRVRRCCTVYPKEDGKFYPVCSYNIMHRGKE